MKKIEERENQGFVPPRWDKERVLIHREEGEIDWKSNIWLVNADSEKEVREAMGNVNLDGIEAFPSMYDCTGDPFGEPAEIKRVGKSRYLVKRIINYDF